MPSFGLESSDRIHLPLETIGVTLPDLDTEVLQMLENDSETWSDNAAPTDDDSSSGNETDAHVPEVLSSPESPEEISVSTDPVPMDMDPIADTRDPIFDISDPIVDTSDPIDDSSDPIDDTSDPIVDISDPIVDPREPFEPVFERRTIMRRARRGRNVARRGRQRERTSDEDTHLTPFERGLTFNGFARRLEPEEVTGFTLDYDDGILYDVKWRNYGTRPRQIESSLMRMYRPTMIIDYYEAVARRNSPR